MKLNLPPKQVLISAFNELERQRSELWELLDKINDESLGLPESPSTWSVNQVLLHLAVAEKGTLSYINKKRLAKDKLTKAGIQSKLRFIFLKLILKMPIKYKMPKQLPDPSNDIGFELVKQQFDSNRAEFKALIALVPEDELDLQVFKHPFLGRFSLLQTLMFMKDHFDHHIIQIKRILKSQ